MVLAPVRGIIQRKQTKLNCCNLFTSFTRPNWKWQYPWARPANTNISKGIKNQDQTPWIKPVFGSIHGLVLWISSCLLWLQSKPHDEYYLKRDLDCGEIWRCLVSFSGRTLWQQWLGVLFICSFCIPFREWGAYKTKQKPCGKDWRIYFSINLVGADSLHQMY